MKFSLASVVVAAAAALVNAAILTNTDYSVSAGVPFTITWSGASGPVTITLKNGPSGDLKTVDVIADGETDGSFTWTPDKSLPAGTYAFEIKDASGINYSPQFELKGGAASSSGASSATSSSTATKTTSSSDTKSTTGTSSKSTSTSISNTTMTTSTTATTQSGSTTTTRTSTSSTSSTPTRTPVPNANNGQHFASPLAFILVTVAALVFMN